MIIRLTSVSDIKLIPDRFPLCPRFQRVFLVFPRCSKWVLVSVKDTRGKYDFSGNKLEISSAFRFVYSINSPSNIRSIVKYSSVIFYEVSNETIIEAPLVLAINGINEERERERERKIARYNINHRVQRVVKQKSQRSTHPLVGNKSL